MNVNRLHIGFLSQLKDSSAGIGIIPLLVSTSQLPVQWLGCLLVDIYDPARAAVLIHPSSDYHGDHIRSTIVLLVALGYETYLLAKPAFYRCDHACKPEDPRWLLYEPDTHDEDESGSRVFLSVEEAIEFIPQLPPPLVNQLQITNALLRTHHDEDLRIANEKLQNALREQKNQLLEKLQKNVAHSLPSENPQHLVRVEFEQKGVARDTYFLEGPETDDYFSNCAMQVFEGAKVKHITRDVNPVEYHSFA